MVTHFISVKLFFPFLNYIHYRSLHLFTGGRLLKVLLWPLQDGETWHPDNCTKEKCDNGKVITDHVPCKPVTKPECENEYQPVKVYDKAGCCFHYECKCKFK